MKRTHRIAVSIGIVTTALISLLFEAFLHVAIVISLVTNLGWLWDDVFGSDDEEKKNDGA